MPVEPNRAYLIYDGDCAFCKSTAQRLAAQRQQGRHPADAVAWQRLGAEELGRIGLRVTDVQRAAWWIEVDGTALRGHQAIARALGACGGWRAGAGRLIGARGMAWLAAPAYRLVARYRHRLPGATPTCRLEP